MKEKKNKKEDIYGGKKEKGKRSRECLGKQIIILIEKRRMS